MSTKVKIVLVVVGLLTAYAAGRFTTPSKIVEKEKIVYKDKIDESKKSEEIASRQKHRILIKLTTVKPDGTRTTETKVYYSDNIEITKNEQETKKEEKSIDKTTEKVVEYSKNEYFISGLVKTNSSFAAPAYGLSVSKRFIGPVYIGAFAYTDTTLGCSLGLGF